MCSHHHLRGTGQPPWIEEMKDYLKAEHGFMSVLWTQKQQKSHSSTFQSVHQNFTDFECEEHSTATQYYDTSTVVY
jgi:hypothetical protein